MAGCQLGLWNVLPIDQRKRMSTRSPGVVACVLRVKLPTGTEGGGGRGGGTIIYIYHLLAL